MGNDKGHSSDGEKTPLIRRILAIVGILILLGVNLIFFARAVTGTFDTASAFLTSAVATVAIPIVIWLFVWAFTAVTGKKTVASADPYGRNEKDIEAKKDNADKNTEEKPELKAESKEESKEAFDETDMKEAGFEPEDKKSVDENSRKEARPDGKINTVIFDIGGVLADFCWEDFIKEKGYVEDTVQKIAEASVKSEAWGEFDRGVLDTADVIKEFVKNNKSLEAELYDCFSDLTGLLRKRERTIPWIRALKKEGYKVLILSNYSKQSHDTNPFMQEFIDEVDGGILSYKEHIIKPDRKIYELICERYNLNPGSCVFIDDTKRNVDAAIAFGMHSILFEDYDQVEADLAKLGVTYKLD